MRGSPIFVAVFACIASAASSQPPREVPATTTCDGNVVVGFNVDGGEIGRDPCDADYEVVCLEREDEHAACDEATCAEAATNLYDVCGMMRRGHATRASFEEACAGEYDACRRGCYAVTPCEDDDVEDCSDFECPPPPPPSSSGGSTCCRVCRTGKACGDSCINVNTDCSQPNGCACNG